MHTESAQTSCFNREFAMIAATIPGEPAVLCEVNGCIRAMTYGQLENYSSRIAGHLLRRGVGPGCCVPFFLERGFDAVAMALGVMKAGASWTFLGKSMPQERLAFILADLAAPLTLCHGKLAAMLPSGGSVVEVDRIDWRNEPPAEPENRTNPDSPLAVFYTSGTTGTPKGVVLTHRNVLAFSRMDNAVNNIGAGSRKLALADMSFDAFLWNILPPLLAGARVYMGTAAVRMSLTATHDFMLRHRIEHAFLTTRLAEEYLAAYDNPHLCTLCIGGESMRPVPERGYVVRNVYGPTETTVYVTGHRVHPGEKDIPIGVALGENRIVIMDRDMNECLDGAEGEICISGPQVSPGYLNNPELTTEKFIANPLFKSSDISYHNRLYRTGDLGAILPNGEIAFRGRMDRQVKIRGYRVEPLEIEIALQRHPAVASAAVVPLNDAEARPYLVAYVVPHDSTAGGEDELRAFLSQTLPPHMIPALIVMLRELPLKPSGKVDAAKLPPPSR